MKKLFLILPLLLVIAYCNKPKQQQNGSQVLAGESAISSKKEVKQCDVVKDGLKLSGTFCSAQDGGGECCSPNDGCITSGKYQGRCWTCDDEEGNLLCPDPSSIFKFACCDSLTQVCGAGGGCVNR